jgi:cell division septation protein DedD
VENNQLASGPGDDLGGDGCSYAVISVPGAAGWVDYTISSEFWMRSRNGRVALVGRWRDKGNFYEAYVQVYRNSRSAFIDIVRDGARKTLAYGVNGVGLDIPSIEGGSPDRRHSLQFTLVGPIMALYLDGKRLIEATDKSFGDGAAGVGVQYSTVYFRNVVVDRAKMIGPTAPVIRTGSAAAPGAGQVYRFLMGTFNTEAEAKRFQGELIGGGYLNVTIEPAGQKWDVLVGAFMNETEAQQERANLEAQGVLIASIVVRTAGTTQYSPVARRRMAIPEVFTLRLGSFTTRDEAEAAKHELELDGFFGSEVRPEGKEFGLVLGSFRSREDAEKYRTLLEAGKHKVLEIATEKAATAPGPATIVSRQLPSAIAQSEVWKNLTAEQQKGIQRLIEEQTAGAADTTQYYMDLKKEVEKLRLETREEITKVVSSLEQRETKQRQLAALFTRVNKSAFAGQYDQARKGLAEILALDPENSMARLIEQQIELREKTLGQTVEQRLSDAQRRQLEREIAAARQRADNFEREKYFQNALLEYETVLSLLTEHNLEPDNQKILGEKIQNLKAQIALSRKEIDDRFVKVEGGVAGLRTDVRGVQEQTGTFDTRFREQTKTLYIIFGGLGLLTAVVVWVFIGVRRRNRLLLEQMRSLTLKPMMEIAGGGGAAGVLPAQKPAREIGAGVGTPPLVAAPAAASGSTDLFPETPAPPQDAFFDMMEPARGGSTSVATAEPEPEISMRLPEESPKPAPTSIGAVPELPEEESPFFESLTAKAGPTAKVTAGAPMAGLSADEEEEVSLGLDRPVATGAAGTVPQFDVEPEIEPLRLEDMDIKTDIVEAPSAPSESSLPPVGPESAPLDLDLMGVGLVEPEAPPAPGHAPGVFYEQSFEDEVIGAVPQNWHGAQESYSFATLKVAEESPAANSKRYLRFEKTEGIGSAYYSCQFPDATGQVVIEFDLRCDSKNKFLLGFYIEKDGDFRQCIHASIRQNEATGAAFLRIYGEEIPYEMGTWRHIKYVVNLMTGRLSGSVNGETVLDNIRLTNCPRSLNTLSIRDNIPTTGVLLIDNIRIARA